MRTKKWIVPVCSLAVLAASCSGSHAPAENPGNRNGAKIQIVQPVYTEIKKDKTVYSGNAQYAEYYDGSRTGIILSPVMDGIMSGGDTFTVSSDKAYYYARDQEITLTDNIRARIGSEYEMTTKKVDYLIDKKLIVAAEPLTVTGRDLQLHARRGSIDLKRNTLTMQGDITAKIYNMSLR